MSKRLEHIDNWPDLAQKAKGSVSALEKLCGVSVRTLERHFLETYGLRPKAWLAEQRQLQAVKLLKEGSSVKEIAANLGYKHSTHFSRDFKGRWGHCLTTN